MKVLLFSLSLLSCLSFSIDATAQKPNEVGQSISKLSFIRPGGPTLSDLSNFGKINRTEGTPYMSDTYIPARIRFEGQPNYSEELEVLMDLEKNELFVKLSTGFTGFFPLGYLDAVELKPSAGEFLYFETLDLNELFGQGDEGRRFYRVLHRGEDYLVLHQPIKYLRREDYIENLGMVRRPDKYLDRNQYWVFDGTTLYEIKSNLRQISKVFPAQAAAMKRLVRDNELNLENPTHLGRLFALLEE